MRPGDLGAVGVIASGQDHVTPRRYVLDMGTFRAVYYRAADGSEPVNDFIDELNVKRQLTIDNQIDRLNMLDPSFPHLPFPHSSQIEAELRELRCRRPPRARGRDAL